MITGDKDKDRKTETLRAIDRQRTGRKERPMRIERTRGQREGRNLRKVTKRENEREEGG